MNIAVLSSSATPHTQVAPRPTLSVLLLRASSNGRRGARFLLVRKQSAGRGEGFSPPQGPWDPSGGILEAAAAISRQEAGIQRIFGVRKLGEWAKSSDARGGPRNYTLCVAATEQQRLARAGDYHPDWYTEEAMFRLVASASEVKQRMIRDGVGMLADTDFEPENWRDSDARRRRTG